MRTTPRCVCAELGKGQADSTKSLERWPSYKAPLPYECCVAAQCNAHLRFTHREDATGRRLNEANEGDRRSELRARRATVRPVEIRRGTHRG
jgi:hypothetical protein